MDKLIETPQYLIDPGHRITVLVIGCGGTGSYVIANLVSLHLYLIHTGRPGLNVFVMDDDIVTEANVGRQLFTPSDIGEYKVNAVLDRYNEEFGLRWIGIPKRFEDDSDEINANIVFSCVDSISSRKKICKSWSAKSNRYWREYERKHFLIDCGNGYDYGQVIVSSQEMPNHNFFHYFADQVDTPDQPSCSMLESIGKQNLFINKHISSLAVNWLYEAIRTTQYNNLGCMFNNNSLRLLYHDDCNIS